MTDAQTSLANSPATRSAVTIHRYESPKMDAVNLYWIEATQGIILVDAGRFLSQARYALEEIRSQSNKPIIGILLTHPHTDHYGGLPVFARAAVKDVPIYASEITANDIRTDGQGFVLLKRMSQARSGDGCFRAVKRWDLVCG
jgi:glyoxylase-like metal-dependent hydrolase (beta-lactamase superfamily II)